MKLIIGGYAQGKLNYVLQKYHLKKSIVCERTIAEDAILQGEIVIINHFHKWVKDCITKGKCPEEEVLVILKQYPDCFIISDEIGNGIVPMDAFEREYRERTGRILVDLANKAEEVERVICGLGQRIK